MINFKFRAWDNDYGGMYNAWVIEHIIYLEVNENDYEESDTIQEIKNVKNGGQGMRFKYINKKLFYITTKRNFDLMQSTGLTDKTGLSIYESDIVELVFPLNKIPAGTKCLVRWNKYLGHYELDINGINQYRLNNLEDLKSFNDEEVCYGCYNEEYEDFHNSKLVLTGGKTGSIVVIGNIYENPELLK